MKRQVLIVFYTSLLLVNFQRLAGAVTDRLIFPVLGDSHTIAQNNEDPRNYGWYVENGFGHYYPTNPIGGSENPYHPAEDWNRTDGRDNNGSEPVYSIGNGVIARIERNNNTYGGTILIRYELTREIDFSPYFLLNTTPVEKYRRGKHIIAQYMHVAVDSNLQTEQPITLGQRLGTIISTYNGLTFKHLHFEIMVDPNGDSYATTARNGIGYYKSQQAITNDGYIDPTGFILSYNVIGSGTELVGNFSDGWHAGVSDAILACYNAISGNRGGPFDNGGGTYVHEWPKQEDRQAGDSYVIIQDFHESAYGADGQYAIIYNPAANAAFPLVWGFWGLYKPNQFSVSGSELKDFFGPRDLGPPTIPEKGLPGDSNITYQEFEKGYFFYDSNYKLDMYRIKWKSPFAPPGFKNDTSYYLSPSWSHNTSLGTGAIISPTRITAMNAVGKRAGSQSVSLTKRFSNTRQLKPQAQEPILLNWAIESPPKNGTIVLNYSLDNGETFSPITTLSISATSYEWTPPFIYGTHFWVKLTVLNAQAMEVEKNASEYTYSQSEPTPTPTFTPTSIPPANEVENGPLFVPVWRMVKVLGVPNDRAQQEHFYTLYFEEANNAKNSWGYQFDNNQQPVFYTSSRKAPGMVKVYRLWKKGSKGNTIRLLTTSLYEIAQAENDGYVQDSVDLGYVYPTDNGLGLSQLRRYWNASIGDRYYTIESGEHSSLINDGYVEESPLGWVSRDGKQVIPTISPTSPVIYTPTPTRTAAHKPTFTNTPISKSPDLSQYLIVQQVSIPTPVIFASYPELTVTLKNTHPTQQIVLRRLLVTAVSKQTNRAFTDWKFDREAFDDILYTFDPGETKSFSKILVEKMNKIAGEFYLTAQATDESLTIINLPCPSTIFTVIIPEDTPTLKPTNTQTPVLTATSTPQPTNTPFSPNPTFTPTVTPTSIATITPTNTPTTTPASASVITMRNNIAVYTKFYTKDMKVYYKISVPSGQSLLKINSWGGTGDVDLYVKYGQLPTLTDSDFVSKGKTTEEIISINNPQNGDYYIMVNYFKDSSGVILVSGYSVPIRSDVDLEVGKVYMVIDDGDTSFNNDVEISNPAPGQSINFMALLKNVGRYTISLYRYEVYVDGILFSYRTWKTRFYSDNRVTWKSSSWNIQTPGIHIVEWRFYADGDQNTYNNSMNLEFVVGDSTVTYEPSVPVIPTPTDVPVVTLQNNVARYTETHTPYSKAYYKVAVPSGQNSLEIGSWGGTGDVDIYVKYGQLPTLGDADFISGGDTNEEKFVINNPQSGDYYIMLYYYKTSESVILVARYFNSVNSGIDLEMEKLYLVVDDGDSFFNNDVEIANPLPGQSIKFAGVVRNVGKTAITLYRSEVYVDGVLFDTGSWKGRLLSNSWTTWKSSPWNTQVPGIHTVERRFYVDEDQNTFNNSMSLEFMIGN